MTHSINEVLSTTQPMIWVSWAAQYIFYLGCSYGAIILFAITYWFYPNKTSHHLRTLLLLVALISAIIAPIAINGDLHQPARVWHFYAYFTPWSWMSIGALLLPLFTLSIVVLTWLYLRHDIISLAKSNNKYLQFVSKLSLGKWQTPSVAITLFTIISVILSFGIVIYTSNEISILKSRSQWHLLILPILWYVSAFMGTLGFTVILNWFADNKFNNYDIKLIKSTAFVISVMTLVLFGLWMMQANLLSVIHSSVWLPYLIVLVVFLIGAIMHSLSNRKNSLAISAWVLVIAAFLIRLVSIVLVQTIPKYDSGIYPYSLPAGADGWLGIIGLLGLWLCLASVLSWLLLTANENANTQNANNPKAATKIKVNLKGV